MAFRNILHTINYLHYNFVYLIYGEFRIKSKNSENPNYWYDNLSNDPKESIQRGLKDADNKNFVSFEDFKASADKLLKRT